MGYGKNKRDIHLFETNVECHRRYYELLKEARIWNGQGQYWLANQCKILSDQLLQGDASVVTTIVKTDQHFVKTKKFT